VISGSEPTKVYEANRGLALSYLNRLEFVARFAGLACMPGWVAIDRSIWPFFRWRHRECPGTRYPEPYLASGSRQQMVRDRSVVRNRRSDLQLTYYQFLGPTGAVAYFSADFFMTFGQTLANLLSDRRYEQVGWMLKLVSAVLLTILFRLATQSFLAWECPSFSRTLFWFGWSFCF
jgi:hypothetical protein